ncbi:MAG: carboxymuconolactone decarboxylase family protein [Candidatus Dormibacteraeota bacterium]|nr:carboxymuconolactone decarboxylase family protein [Candidatus Dormibacteraeota bacterium]
MERSALREAWSREHGTWNPEWEDLLDQDPGFFRRLLDLSAHPFRRGPLEPKVRQLVLLAIDAAATHLYAPGVRAHVRRALHLGATPAEVLEVLELTSTLGIHACTVGVPILLEELESAGQPAAAGPLTPRQEAIKADFSAQRGYWNPFWDGLLRLDAEFFAAYTAFSSWPWETGPLEPKVKELIYTAFDVSATHLYEPGLRQHVRNALSHGATGAEILEVFELASTLGAKALALGAPELSEAIGKQATKNRSASTAQEESLREDQSRPGGQGQL